MPTGRKDHREGIGRAFKRMRLKISTHLQLTLTDVKRMNFEEFLFYYKEADQKVKAEARKRQGR